MPKNFAQIHHLILAKAFEIPKDFSRKVLWFGVWGGQPQLTTTIQKTHGNAVRFIFSSLYVGTAIPNIRFRSIACCIFFVLVMVI